VEGRRRSRERELMPRTMSQTVAGQLAGKLIQLAIFAQLAFADNTLYLFSGINSLTPAGPAFNPASTFPYGKTFIGLGWLAKLSSIPQTTKIQAQNVTLSLSGIPPNLVSEVVGQVRMTGTVTMWYGFFLGGALIADPVQVFSGSMDVPSLTDDADSSESSIACENTLLSLNLAPNRRFDDLDQQLDFPGDLGFSFVQALANIQLFWPAPVNEGTPYPVFMEVTPSSVDVAVGSSITIEVTIHFSDGSTFTRPSGVGSGPAFALCAASSNPRIASWQYTATNNVTGVSPGECSIMARVPGPSTGGGPGSQFRAVCNIFVYAP
jgi:hypothetical protein